MSLSILVMLSGVARCMIFELIVLHDGRLLERLRQLKV